MAKPRNSSPLLSHLLLLLLFFFFSFFSTTQQQQPEMNRGGGGRGGLVLGRRTEGGGGRLVGGRTKVEDVNTNKEVQELGKYCVEQYNKNREKSSNGSSISRPAVVFVKVVEAEKQVVSGIKYYLKISAAVSGGSGSSGIVETFNAVVVVKPWADSKDMLSFCPSPSPSPSVSTK